MIEQKPLRWHATTTTDVCLLKDLQGGPDCMPPFDRQTLFRDGPGPASGNREIASTNARADQGVNTPLVPDYGHLA